MSLYVLKFGGTSVANTERIAHVAHLIKSYADQGHDIIVVVSAMAGFTNQMLGFAKDISGLDYSSEHDVVCASGEQITAGLLALALQKRGLSAQSFLAHQLPIFTDNTPSHARITGINTDSMINAIEHNIIPVIAGFQGVYKDEHNNYRITTLGRGGSDTTAVALAAAVHADTCFIYTDVEGVYTADPRIVPGASKLEHIGYTQMLNLASHGAKVLHKHCVEHAMHHNVNLCILSSFVNAPGTHIGTHDNHISLRNNHVTGIAHALNLAHVSMHFKDTINAESICSNLDTSIHDTRINTLLSQMHIFDLHYDDFYSTPPNQLHFFIPKTECERAQKMFLELKDLLAFDLLEINPNIATLTIVGTRFTQDSKYLQSVLQVLQANHIPILFLHTLETKIIVAIHYNHLSKAIIMLHDTVCNL